MHRGYGVADIQKDGVLEREPRLFLEKRHFASGRRTNRLCTDMNNLSTKNAPDLSITWP
jgi:hypothetical protein